MQTRQDRPQPYHPAAQDRLPMKLSRAEPGQYLDGRPGWCNLGVLAKFPPLALVNHGLLIILIHLIGSISLSSPPVGGERTGAVVLWLPSHHPSGCCTLVVVEERPPHMIVKHFGCTAIHNKKALYKCFIHSFIQDKADRKHQE